MTSKDPVVFVTEPLLSPEFVQYRTQAPLLQRISDAFEVTVVAPGVSKEVARLFEDVGVRALSTGAMLPPVRHPHDEVPSFLVAWARDATLGLNRRASKKLLKDLPGLHLNLSMTTTIPADSWYVQGRPMDVSLEALAPSFSPLLRTAAKLARAPLGILDRRHFELGARVSKAIYTNSRFNALWFRERGVPVRGVISQYYSSVGFAPTTQRPSRDYILVYLGKETDTAAVRLLMDLDFPIKMFGAKSSGWVDGSLRGSASTRVEFLGRVSEEELARLYSNALFTAFPFTEEPFGLVPVESMACGTPVLTYRWQGPGETVLDGRTGWLVSSPSQFVVKAHEICERRYPASMTDLCHNRAREFFVDHVAKVWKDLLRAHLAGEPDPPECLKPLEGAGHKAPTERPSRATMGAVRSLGSWH